MAEQLAGVAGVGLVQVSHSPERCSAQMEVAPLALRQAEEHASEKYSSITLEQAEDVYLQVFKTIHSKPKMVIQLWH